MRATERRLARIKAALQHVATNQERQASLRDNAEWRAAGGPVSVVCGTTRGEAKKREAMLRDVGLIQPVDKVVLVPMRPEFSKPFARNCLLQDWGPEKREAIRAALDSPSPPLPAGW